MSNPITDNTKLQCNQGTQISTLKVTSQTFMSIKGKLQATEGDKEANINIKPFALCKLKPTFFGYQPCVPAPIQWEDTAEKDTINGQKILTENSYCMCSVGGKITIKDKGHNENHNAE